MRCLDSIMASVDVNLSKLWEMVENRGPWRAAVHGVKESDVTATEQQMSKKSVGSELGRKTSPVRWGDA